MKPSAWPATLAATLAGLILVPAAAMGSPPDRIQVCHFTADEVPDRHRWNPVQVSVKSLDKHLAHGDGTPGGEVPGSNGAAFFDEQCTPQLPGLEPLPDEPSPDDPLPDDPLPDEPLPDEPSELVFAVAYSDMNSDGGYNPAEDVLIAKLIDGPGLAGDGLPGVDDLIITHLYPMDFGPSAHGEFALTEHVVTKLNVGFSDVCNMQSDESMFVWSNSEGATDFYHESISGGARTEIVDGIRDMGDWIQVSSASPSLPMAEVALLNGSDETDRTFIDVEANCLIDGS